MKCPVCKKDTPQLMFRNCDVYEVIPLHYCPVCKKIWQEKIEEVKIESFIN